MSNYTESDIIPLLQDPATRRKGFGLVVKIYSEQLYWQIRRMVYSHDDANDLLQTLSSRRGVIWIISEAMQNSPLGCIASL